MANPCKKVYFAASYGLDSPLHDRRKGVLMKKIAEYARPEGSVEFFEDTDKNIFLAQPHGVINPELIKEDLNHARRFAEKVDKPWFYVTNTEDLKLANPLNLLYLKEVKKLNKIEKIVVYAPGFVNRMLLRMASFLVQPDRILKHKKDLAKFLGTAQSIKA